MVFWLWLAAFLLFILIIMLGKFVLSTNWIERERIFFSPQQISYFGSKRKIKIDLKQKPQNPFTRKIFILNLPRKDVNLVLSTKIIPTPHYHVYIFHYSGFGWSCEGPCKNGQFKTIGELNLLRVWHEFE